MTNKILLSAYIGCAGFIGYTFASFRKEGIENWIDAQFDLSTRFPPRSVPALPPRPGYKVVGYMGCPESSIQAIAKKERLLFFAKTIDIPQRYALERTSWWSQWQHQDNPVVLQLEVPEDTDITDQDLWQDRRLTEPQMTPFAPQFISFSPAIPEKIQREKGLEARLHHRVTWENFQGPEGNRQRALQAFLKSFSYSK